MVTRMAIGAENDFIVKFASEQERLEKELLLFSESEPLEELELDRPPMSMRLASRRPDEFTVISGATVPRTRPGSTGIAQLSEEELSRVLSFLLTLGVLPQIALVCRSFRAAVGTPWAWRGTVVAVGDGLLDSMQSRRELQVLGSTCWSFVAEVRLPCHDFAPWVASALRVACPQLVVCHDFSPWEALRPRLRWSPLETAAGHAFDTAHAKLIRRFWPDAETSSDGLYHDVFLIGGTVDPKGGEFLPHSGTINAGNYTYEFSDKSNFNHVEKHGTLDGRRKKPLAPPRQKFQLRHQQSGRERRRLGLLTQPGSGHRGSQRGGSRR